MPSVLTGDATYINVTWSGVPPLVGMNSSTYSIAFHDVIALYIANTNATSVNVTNQVARWAGLGVVGVVHTSRASP